MTWSTQLISALERHPLALYFSLTFCLSWSFWIPGALLFAGTGQAESLLNSPVFILLQTLGAAGPSLAAVFVVHSLYGRQKLNELFGRFKKWKAGKGWYLVSIFMVPLIAFASISVRALAALVGSESFALPAEYPLRQTLDDIGLLGLVLSLPVIFVSQLFTSPLLEELGWRGFALPMLQDKFNALGSSLILGLIWGAWHLPLILAYGDNVLAYLALMIAHTILMSWVFNSTGGSLLIALLFHASLNVSLNVLAIERQDVIQLLLTWAVVALVIVRYGAQDLSDSRRFRW